MSDRHSPDILASDNERETTVERLQAACVDGRLTLEEYAQRAGYALSARTRGELDKLVRDLPIVPVISGEQPTVYVATLGSVKRTGRWRLGEHLRIRALLGSCRLDLRDAVISSRVSTIELDVTLGSVEVIVPIGVEVDVEVGIVVGSRTIRLKGVPAPGAPLIRLTGVVRGGSLTVRDDLTLSEHIQGRLRALLEP